MSRIIKSMINDLKDAAGNLKNSLENMDMKQLFLASFPYIAAACFGSRAARLWRVSPENTVYGRLFAAAEGLQGVFISPVPSLFPKDFAFGVLCGVLLRLAVYFKAQNTRKFRHGREYGSARWGSAKDMKPYTDPVFENNIPLTQTERLTMNSRPKQPKYARNKNILVIGGSGSGKTRFFVKPSLMQMHSSYVVTDPNG